MEFKIEGYTIDQLEALGKQVQTVDTRRLSVSGDAFYVAQVYTALGLFAPVVSELKKFAPIVEPISDELRMQGKLMGLSDADMDRMRAQDSNVPTYQTILPNEMLPFGIVIPVADGHPRRNALLHLKMVLLAFKATIPKPHVHGATESFDMVLGFRLALKEFLSVEELDSIFNDILFAGNEKGLPHDN
jgi:hypothetical protein